MKKYPKNIRVIDESKIEFFQNELLNWFEENGRYFPWRKKSATNYELIISEVFLQRTRAETIANFLPQFLKKYPNWKFLGEAKEFELQEALIAIGLHRQRGSRLYRLAQELKKRKNRFPRKRNEVEEIPMMGQYIINAFELYVLKKNSPLLDVNMARLLERFFGERRLADIRYDPYLQSLAYNIVNVDKSKQLNWAILDYASVVCKKHHLDCENCVLNVNCKYYFVKNLHCN